MEPTSSTASPSIVPSVALGTLIALVPSLLGRLAAGNQMLGMVIGVLSCLAMLGGGAFAAWHFARKGRFSLTAKDGAWMGLYVGLATFAVSMLILLVTWLSAGTPSLTEFMLVQAERSGQEITPEAREALASNPWILGMGLIFGSVMQLVLPVLGGLLGAQTTRSSEQTY